MAVESEPMEYTDEAIDSTAALVGAAGGAGATRLSVEAGAALARDGRRVAVFDVALGTQGLADYVDGSIGTDLTELLVDPDVRTREATVEYLTAGRGELHLCPARAAFERIARAKTTEAAGRLESAIRDAGVAFDHVIVDTPPVATNPAVAAVTSTERVGVVAPATPRGADALQRTRGRLADVGTEADLVVTNRGDGPADADIAVPESERADPADAPVCDLGSGGPFEDAVVELACELFETDVERSEGSGVIGGLLER
jgi:MinD-like ATPase involved in chromosome partitioning or flagellar assembly